MKREKVMITTPFIKLDSFLKLSGAVSTGGEAKGIILEGNVKVNDEVCLMRGKKLVAGDQVIVYSVCYEVSPA